MNISIPSSAFSSGKGSFTWPTLQFHQAQQFLVSMGDATGYASGGVSTVQSTGASISGIACNTTDPGPTYSYELNSALVQCRYYNFSGYNGASQPLTILGYIPGGNVIVLHPPSGQNSYAWQDVLAAGTSVVFAMIDAQGRSGGASDILTSGTSNDNSCLNSSSPSSTSGAPSATSSSSHSSGTSSTTIGLGVLGGVVGLAIIVALIIFYFRRWSRSQRSFSSIGAYRSKSTSHGVQPVNLMDNPDHVSDPDPELIAHVTPYSYQASIAGSSNQAYSRANFDDPDFAALSALPQSQSPITEMSKAQRAGVRDYNRQQRLILHTDVEDAVPDDQDQDVIELPPQYNERRAPIPHLNESFSSLPQTEERGSHLR